MCWIPLVPQRLGPLVMLVTEASTRSWFLALYLPSPFSWLTALAMTALGLAMLAVAVQTTRRLRRATQRG